MTKVSEVALICVRRCMVRYHEDQASPERQVPRCVVGLPREGKRASGAPQELRRLTCPSQA